MVTLGSIACDYDLQRDDTLVVGLVNNMPDAALRATERQFSDLLSAGARNRSIRLRLFFLPGIPRGRDAQAFLSDRYEDISQLWGSRVDGLIVTGTEPRAHLLSEEPYWPFFARLVDWTESHTVSTLWSCLAAHAAVLRLDGINRRRFAQKLFGLFDCSKVSDHPIVDSAPSRWQVPHSRYNDLPEEELVACGYRILSRAADAGADMFVSHRQSLFVFTQGHPEYDADTLLREYRRDVQRYLSGARDTYPEIPRGYFDQATFSKLDAFRQHAARRRDSELMDDFPVVPMASVGAWRQVAVDLYTNWLSYLADQISTERGVHLAR
ncbi:MAG TPA: homoserine O-succinyltransferase [Candidatus Binataceae bacterium]|nr:homoserine O-succinyltransferase [Candidatus Binataceae bacterium]